MFERARVSTSNQNDSVESAAQRTSSHDNDFVSVESKIPSPHMCGLYWNDELQVDTKDCGPSKTIDSLPLENVPARPTRLTFAEQHTMLPSLEQALGEEIQVALNFLLQPN